jgi:DnaK suppressor protein
MCAIEQTGDTSSAKLHGAEYPEQEKEMATMLRRIRTDRPAGQQKLQKLLRQQGAVLQDRKRAFRESQASAVTDIEEHSLDAEEQGVAFSVLELTSETLQGIETALQRVEAGEFGTCSLCRGPISASRLRALPFAALCLDCQDNKDRTAVSRWRARHPSR